MSIAISNAIPPVPPPPVLVPAQVQLAQGAAVPVAPLAVTANEKREDSKDTKNETGRKSEENDPRRGKLIDRFA